MELSEKESVLRKSVHDALDSSLSNITSESFREEASRYTVQFLKAAPLFLPSVGKVATSIAYGSAAIFNGLDQAKSGDSLDNQLLDFGLGAAKGAALKGTFDALGKIDFKVLANSRFTPQAIAGTPMELSTKAFSFGISSRLLENGLSRQTYQDGKGDFNLSLGLQRNLSETFAPSALATDLLIFGGSALALKGINKTTGGFLDRSVFAQTLATGGSFGLFSGSLGELQKQRQENKFDFLEIAKRGILEAGVTTLAASPGGVHMARLTAIRPGKLADSEQTPTPEPAGKESAAEGISEPAARMTTEPEWLKLKLANVANDNPTELADPLKRNRQLVQDPDYVPEDPKLEPALIGAKQFSTADDIAFYQLTDGRIVHPAPQTNIPSIWVPYGSNGRIGTLAMKDIDPAKKAEILKHGMPVNAKEEGLLFDIHELNERHGVYTDAAGEIKTGIPAAVEYDPKVSEKVDNKTAKRLSDRETTFESDWQAGLRILKGAKGEIFTRSTLKIQERVPATKEGEADTYISREIPARTYRIMPEDMMHKLDDAATALKDKQINKASYDKIRKEADERSYKVVVPEEYAQRLDALRDLRKLGTLSPEMFPEIAEQINENRREIFLSPYRNRLLPEHFGQFLDALPNNSLHKEIVLLDAPASKYRKADSTALADVAQDTGRIRFFEEGLSVDSATKILTAHEWSHLSEWASGVIKQYFESAAKAESFFGRSYAKEIGENWAVNMGEMFLHPSADIFLTLAHKAPLQTLLMSKAIEKQLSQSGSLAPSRDYIKARIEYVNEHVASAARKSLSEALTSGHTTSVVEASDLVYRMVKNGDKELAKSLLDLEMIERGANFRPEEQPFLKQDVLLRLALRTDALRQVAPEIFQHYEKMHKELVDKLKATNSALLVNGDPATVAKTLDMANTFKEKRGRETLFSELFEDTALEQVARDSSQAENAIKAYEIYRRTYGVTAKGFDALLKIAESEGPTKQQAIETVLAERLPYWVARTAGTIEKLIANKPTEQTLKTLDLNLEAEVRIALEDGAVSGTPRDIAQGLIKGALLEKLAQVKPDLVDPEVLSIIKAAREKAPEAVTKSISAKNEILKDLTSGTFIRNDLSMDALRQILPEKFLEEMVRAQTSMSSEALNAMKNLYYASTLKLSSELAQKSSPLQIELLQNLLETSNIAYLKQASSAIENMARSLSMPQRTAFLKSLDAAIPAAKSNEKIDEAYKQRIQMRISLAEKLIEPIPMDLREPFIQNLLIKIEDLQARFAR